MKPNELPSAVPLDDRLAMQESAGALHPINTRVSTLADPKQGFVPVTQPYLPPLAEFTPYLEEIWQRKWVTNNGVFHQRLEAALCDYLGARTVPVGGKKASVAVIGTAKRGTLSPDTINPSTTAMPETMSPSPASVWGVP